jgi:outer membrane protein assembly factor BamD
MKDYVEASYYFKNFTEYFPTSKETEECEYMSAVCLFKFAPKYSLDQTNTIKALEALQSYVNRHPKSPRVAEAATFIDASRKKLEQKEADGAKLYYNITQYKAATVAYRSVIRDYPESPNNDLYQYMIVKSMFRFAKQSIPEKQEERFSATITAFRELKDNYPKSQYLADAEKIVNEATNNVKKIRDEHK